MRGLHQPHSKVPKQVVLLILTLAATCAVGQRPAMDSTQIDERVHQMMRDAGIPGLSLALINDGKTAYYKTYGVKRAKSDDRVNPQTIFEAASLTKPVIAYCALKMVSEKLLVLDDPLYQYLEYTDAAHDDRYRTITARRVLSHTSGFPNWRSDRSADTLNIRFEPGSKFGYSGEGFVYLQKVLEKIAGTDLNSIANRYVFAPLEMNRSSLVLRDDDNYAIGHDKKLNPGKKGMPRAPNAAYSLHTTAGDYAKFLNELIAPRFLGNALQHQMMSVQSHMFTQDASLAWGLGIGLNILNEDTYIWHWGDNGVFRAFFIAAVDSGLGFVYFANSENGLGIVKRLIELIYSNPEIMGSWKKYEQF